MAANLADLASRYTEWHHHKNLTDTFIQDLMNCIRSLEYQLQQQTVKIENAELDLQDAQKSRRALQQELRAATFGAEELENQLKDLKERHPYVALLLDGDGIIFKNKWIEQGVEGGKKAAYALNAAVKKYADSMGRDIEVSCSIFANLGGLGKAMVRDGAITDHCLLKDFSLGFTQAKAAFDFVDVGYGKERADSKLREMTRWHLSSSNCKQLLLGISHDSGYAPFLDNILQNEETRARVTVLEGVSTNAEIRATNVALLQLEEADLFRTDKLGERIVAPAVLSKPQAIIRDTSSPGAGTTAPSTPNSQSAEPSYASTVSTVSTNPPAKAASPPPQMTLPLAKQLSAAARAKSITPSKKSGWSPGARGLDPKIYVNQATMSSIKARKGTNKLCNHYFLRGECPSGYTCDFVHDYSPTEDELNAIRILCRVNPCAYGQYCEDADCFYGHHCPSVTGNECTHPYCRYARDAHPPSTTFRNTSIDHNESLN